MNFPLIYVVSQAYCGGTYVGNLWQRWCSVIVQKHLFVATSCRFLLAQKRKGPSFPQHTMALMISSRNQQYARFARAYNTFSNYFLRSLQRVKVSIKTCPRAGSNSNLFLDFLLYVDDHYMHDKSLLSSNISNLSSQCLKIKEKVSLKIASEASYVYILTKVP